MIALVTSQETACAETALCSAHDNRIHRADMERVAREGNYAAYDAPLPESWRDCTGNEVLECQICGKKET